MYKCMGRKLKYNFTGVIWAYHYWTLYWAWLSKGQSKNKATSLNVSLVSKPKKTVVNIFQISIILWRDQSRNRRFQDQAILWNWQEANSLVASVSKPKRCTEFCPSLEQMELVKQCLIPLYIAKSANRKWKATPLFIWKTTSFFW